MATNFAWKVTQVEIVAKNNLDDVVVTVCFEVEGKDGDLVATMTGDTKLLPPDADSFAGFSTLTEAQVVAWAKAALDERGVAYYESVVQQKLDGQKAPQPKIAPLPWASPEGT